MIECVENMMPEYNFGWMLIVSMCYAVLVAIPFTIMLKDVDLKIFNNTKLKNYFSIVAIFTIVFYIAKIADFDEIENREVKNKVQLYYIDYLYSTLNGEILPAQNVNEGVVKKQVIDKIDRLAYASNNDFIYLNHLYASILKDNKIQKFEYDFLMNKVDEIVSNKEFYLNKPYSKSHDSLVKELQEKISRDID